MKDQKLIYKAFEFIQANDIDTIKIGFTILELYWNIIKQNHHYYNKLIKHFILLSTRRKYNSKSIEKEHSDFLIKHNISPEYSHHWSMYNHSIKLREYFKNNIL
jgi:hypothetical protein